MHSFCICMEMFLPRRRKRIRDHSILPGNILDIIWHVTPYDVSNVKPFLCCWMELHLACSNCNRYRYARKIYGNDNYQLYSVFSVIQVSFFYLCFISFVSLLFNWNNFKLCLNIETHIFCKWKAWTVLHLDVDFVVNGLC